MQVDAPRPNRSTSRQADISTSCIWANTSIHISYMETFVLVPAKNDLQSWIAWKVYAEAARKLLSGAGGALEAVFCVMQCYAILDSCTAMFLWTRWTTPRQDIVIVQLSPSVEVNLRSVELKRSRHAAVWALLVSSVWFLKCWCWALWLFAQFAICRILWNSSDVKFKSIMLCPS